LGGGVFFNKFSISQNLKKKKNLVVSLTNKISNF